MSELLGKISQPFFEQSIFQQCGFPRKEVKAGPQFGVDVSLVELPGGMAMAMTSDPLSLIPSLGLQESAWLSVHLMANDMATTGHAPMYGQFVLNLPASLTKNDFSNYWNYMHQYCSDIKISITGGHTGFIEGQNSTIAGGGTFVTVAPAETMLLSKGAKPGNAILVTKTAALSSAAILSMSFPKTVQQKAGTEIYQLACESFYKTSSLQDALTAVNNHHEQAGITAMHDVTEGGVLGAIYELAIASGNGALIYNNQLPIHEVQETVCSIFSLDPRYCIGAGAMIITCKKESAPAIIQRLAAQQIDCTVVGEICEVSESIMLDTNGHKSKLLYMEEDPYWAAFFKAINAGWK